MKFIVSQVKSTRKQLIFWQLASTSPVGALAYVVEEQALFVKVNSGWQYVLVSEFGIGYCELNFMKKSPENSTFKKLK